jgi:hypothetical protein
MKPTTMLYWQNAVILNVRAGGTYSNHYALNDYRIQNLGSHRKHTLHVFVEKINMNIRNEYIRNLSQKDLLLRPYTLVGYDNRSLVYTYWRNRWLLV